MVMTAHRAYQYDVELERHILDTRKYIAQQVSEAAGAAAVENIPLTSMNTKKRITKASAVVLHQALQGEVQNVEIQNACYRYECERVMTSKYLLLDERLGSPNQDT